MNAVYCIASYNTIYLFRFTLFLFLSTNSVLSSKEEEKKKNRNVKTYQWNKHHISVINKKKKQKKKMFDERFLTWFTFSFYFSACVPMSLPPLGGRRYNVPVIWTDAQIYHISNLFFFYFSFLFFFCCWWHW